MSSSAKRVAFITKIVPTAPKEKYEFVDDLVTGKFTSIYKAKLRNDNQNKDIKLFAIKILKRYELHLNEREVNILKKLDDSRHIVKVYDFIEEEPKLFSIVMELCMTDLYEILIEKKIVVEVPEKKTMFSHILRGLDAIHSRNIIHRDIKTKNLLLSYDGYVKIGDFGIACQGPPFYADHSTIFTDQVGSLYYRAPEVLLGERKYSERIDLWAAGCVAYELWSNEILFKGTNEKDQLEKITEIFGFISEESWEAVRKLDDHAEYERTTAYRYRLESSLRDKLEAITKDEGVIEMMLSLLSINPYQRKTAEVLLLHNIFDIGSKPPPAYNLFSLKMVVEMWPRTAAIPRCPFRYNMNFDMEVDPDRDEEEKDEEDVIGMKVRLSRLRMRDQKYRVHKKMKTILQNS
ncbi:cyclin-dependent kinase 5 homolog [Nilaparvata lugens]|uniref:cyclin-dependent kinase 5 homolog n=1 Tax=Nilaparvata lugens TaxID=108931 RepID=UPI00193D8FCA|nr:cyclin-dependent kinase 5 homolog [Nilaparvata lugens]